MTPQEQIINLIEIALIEKYGEDEFLSLSEREKNIIISEEIVNIFKQVTK